MSKLGEKFYDRYNDLAVTRVYLGSTKEILSGYEAVVREALDLEDDFDGESDLYDVAYEGIVENYQGYFEEEDIPVSENVINERRDKANQIKELLKEVKGLDFDNLILSDGQVYSGYNECAEYIQGTYAWCSSSMEC